MEPDGQGEQRDQGAPLPVVVGGDLQRADQEGHRQQGDEGQQGQLPEQHPENWRDHAGDEERGVEGAGASVAEPDHQGVTAGVPVGGEVAKVVGDQHGHRQESDGDGRPPCGGADPVTLDGGGRQRRHQAKEGEDGQIGHHAGGGVGAGPAGVEERGGERDPPGDEQPELAGRQDQPQTDHRGDRQAGEGGGQDRTRTDQAAGGEPPGPDPGGGVHPAAAVEVVVGQVGAHLDADGDHQRTRRRQRLGVTAGRGTEQDRHRADTEGARPSPGQPEAGGLARATPPCEGGGGHPVTAGGGSGRSRGGASPGRRRGPPGPPRSCSRGGWRHRPAAGSRPGHRRRR